METDKPQSDTPSIPEPGPSPEPSFDEPAKSAPAVVDTPERNNEF